MLTQTETQPSISPPVKGRQSTTTTADGKGLVEQVVTWASVSYAAGFFVVLLHTWRLGLPVLDLVQAVYVWIGMPLAVFAYFANRLWQYFRRRLDAHMTKLRSSLTDSPLPDIEPALILHVAELAVSHLVSGIVTLRIIDWMLAHARKRLTKTSGGKQALRFLNWILRVPTVFGALLTLLNLFVGLALVAATVASYVWFAYPLIPQSLGGGAPARVRLVLDATKIAPDFSKVADLGASWSKDGPPILSSELQLLYKTADGFWLARDEGPPFLLDKSMVLSLVYSRE